MSTRPDSASWTIAALSSPSGGIPERHPEAAELGAQRREARGILVEDRREQGGLGDLEGRGDVRSHAGGVETGRRAAEWAREGEERGAGEILLTSIDTDGTRDGYDLELTSEVAASVSVPVIASGGAGSAGHVAAALEVAQAALLASILHENPARLETRRAELRSLGVPLRDAA